MNLLLQLRQPLIDGSGIPKTQVAGEFATEGVHGAPYEAETFVGTLIIPREEVFVVLQMPDDFDRQSLADNGHILIAN